MKENTLRNIFYYKHYYLDFFEQLKPEVKKKFNWTLKLISTIEMVPVKYFRHLTGTTGIFKPRLRNGLFCEME